MGYTSRRAPSLLTTGPLQVVGEGAADADGRGELDELGAVVEEAPPLLADGGAIDLNADVDGDADPGTADGLGVTATRPGVAEADTACEGPPEIDAEAAGAVGVGVDDEELAGCDNVVVALDDLPFVGAGE